MKTDTNHVPEGLDFGGDQPQTTNKNYALLLSEKNDDVTEKKGEKKTTLAESFSAPTTPSRTRIPARAVTNHDRESVHESGGSL